MKRDRGCRTVAVFVVVLPRTLLLDIAGPIEVLRKANLLQDEVRFEVNFIGPAPTVNSSIGIGLFGIAALPEVVPDGSVVLISGAADQPLGYGTGDRERDRPLEDATLEWLRRTMKPGLRLITICSGAILAARAGLLEGYECTTHHELIDELQRAAPTAAVRANRLYVEDGDRLSSAGITAGIDLMLAFVAKEVGHSVTLSIARYLVVYLRRGGGDPQLSPWLEGRNHVHPAIHRAQDAVVAHPSGDWSVERLADISGTSPRNLSRLFNEQTGMSVTEYVNVVRVALARELLVGSRLKLEAVAEQVGFTSTRQFRRVWNRMHDFSPTRMREISSAQV